MSVILNPASRVLRSEARGLYQKPFTKQKLLSRCEVLAGGTLNLMPQYAVPLFTMTVKLRVPNVQ